MQVGTFIGVAQPKQELAVRVIRQSMTPLTAPQFAHSRGKQQVRRFPQEPDAHRQLPHDDCDTQQSIIFRFVFPQLHEPQRLAPPGQTFEPYFVQQNVLLGSAQQVEEHAQLPPHALGQGLAQPEHEASADSG